MEFLVDIIWLSALWTRHPAAIRLLVSDKKGFLGGSDGREEPACNTGDLGLIPGSGRSPGEGNAYPLQNPGLENSMDRETCPATVCGVSKSRTWLSDCHFHILMRSELAVLLLSPFVGLLLLMLSIFYLSTVWLWCVQVCLSELILLGVHWASSVYKLIFFHHICKGFGHVIFSFSSAPFLLSSPPGCSLCICSSLWVSQRPLSLLFFLYFCPPDWIIWVIIWPILMLADSSTHLNLLLSPSSETLSNCTSKLQNACWFHFIILSLYCGALVLMAL